MTGLHISTLVLLTGIAVLQFCIFAWGVTLQTIHLMRGGDEGKSAPNVEWLANAIMPISLMAVAVVLVN